MADKRIDELEEATSITGTDLFVLEQANTAKKLTGQTMTNFLLALANGHGGISTIAKTSSSGTNPVVDTYTITFADNTTTTFQVTNGVKGDQGPRGYTGNPGADITITSTSVQYQEWTSGTSYPTGTWLDNPPSIAQGNFLWTRTIVNYSDGGQTVAYSVARNGVDGSGAVSTVCGVSPDGSGNVALTASDVGALPSSYQAPVTSVNGETGAVNLDASDVGAVAGDSVSKTISASGWYRVLKHTGSIPDGGIIKFKIGRNQNGDCHEIDLHVPHGHSFVNEISTSGTNLGITKIRLTQGSTYLYVDIYYALSATSIVRVDFIPAGTITQSNIAAETLQSVNDAPSGETVLEMHNFSANASPVQTANVSDVLRSGTFTSADQTLDYTATVPCWFYGSFLMQANSTGMAYIELNNVRIYDFSMQASLSHQYCFVPVPLQPGDRIYVYILSNDNSTYKIVAMR